ncbi:MAG: hypothetical protein Q8K75_07085 [Chlamydiales bacterium]|nr:hypothetical protein [Chlamydiales bacterium]
MATEGSGDTTLPAPLDPYIDFPKLIRPEEDLSVWRDIVLHFSYEHQDTLHDHQLEVLPGNDGTEVEHKASAIVLQRLLGVEFKLEDFESKFREAHNKAKQKSALEENLSKARESDYLSGPRIIRNGAFVPGPMEREATLLFEEFLQEWYLMGAELVEMVSLLPNPEVKQELLIQINGLFGII